MSQYRQVITNSTTEMMDSSHPATWSVKIRLPKETMMLKGRSILSRLYSMTRRLKTIHSVWKSSPIRPLQSSLVDRTFTIALIKQPTPLKSKKRMKIYSIWLRCPITQAILISRCLIMVVHLVERTSCRRVKRLAMNQRKRRSWAPRINWWIMALW
jgi:hypothetical protein